MKQLLLALALLSLPALGQQVDSSQVKLKTNGGLSGDASNALSVTVYRGISAPSSPLAGAEWCDTNTTPCILKQYNGSVWQIPLTPASVATQADTSSFPGSPSDGQIFFSASPPSLWVYSTTLGAWATFAMPLVTSAANIRDVYTAAVIGGGTIAAPTVAASATAGSLSAGAYVYKVSCRNSTGGETSYSRATQSASVSPGGSKSTDLSSIPTCSTGGTTRSIYRSKTNTTSELYWAATIADNTTTTLNDGVADSALKGLMPDIDFSAALPSGWTVTNLQTNGGCGGTGATRGSMACYNGGLATTWPISVTMDAASARGSLSIASYTSGNFTMQYRVKQLSQNGDTYLTVVKPPLFGMRNGTADNQQMWMILAGDNNCGTTLPFSSGNHGCFAAATRATLNGVSSGSLVGNPYPEIDALPLWVRWVRRGATAMAYLSADAVSWQPASICTGTNNTNALCSLPAFTGASSMDHVEIPFSYSGTPQAAGNGPWIEVDSFTLTVN